MKYKIQEINYYTQKYLDEFFDKIYIQKRNRISKYKKVERLKSSIIGEILLNGLLKENYNCDYENLIFSLNDNNKPYIKDKKIFYNISHSYNYIITAISDYEIGVDIEKIRKTSIKTINYFATLKEKQYILSNTQNIEKRLFEIYTLKEAYFKMKGTDLSKMKSIEFTIINHNNIYCNDESVSLKLIDNLKGYMVAICEKKI